MADRWRPLPRPACSGFTSRATYRCQRGCAHRLLDRSPFHQPERYFAARIEAGVQYVDAVEYLVENCCPRSFHPFRAVEWPGCPGTDHHAPAHRMGSVAPAVAAVGERLHDQGDCRRSPGGRGVRGRGCQGNNIVRQKHQRRARPMPLFRCPGRTRSGDCVPAFSRLRAFLWFATRPSPASPCAAGLLGVASTSKA